MKLDKRELERLYIDKKLSTWAIERLTGESRSSIYRRLKESGVRIRNIVESHIRHKRNHFSGNVFEKAYLMGFAIGDLRVRKCGFKKSETISIACSSTKLAQIELIESLFSPYGYIWKSKPNKRKVVNIEAFVDLSFDFLLPSNIINHDWVFADNRYFLPFLGGFTDAEGSIFISKRNNQAVISWGNYNHVLIAKIRNNFQGLGIKTGSIICDHLKGYRGQDGYRRQSDYYHLSCSRMKSLEQLLVLIKPFLKHEDKILALNQALKNIRLRTKI